MGCLMGGGGGGMNGMVMVTMMVGSSWGDGVWMGVTLAHMVSVAVLGDVMMFVMVAEMEMVTVMSCVPAKLCVGVLIEGTW